MLRSVLRERYAVDFEGFKRLVTRTRFKPYNLSNFHVRQYSASHQVCDRPGADAISLCNFCSVAPPITAGCSCGRLFCCFHNLSRLAFLFSRAAIIDAVLVALCFQCRSQVPANAHFCRVRGAKCKRYWDGGEIVEHALRRRVTLRGGKRTWEAGLERF